MLRCVQLCDPQGCSHQAPLPMGFRRQEYWSGLPFPPPGDLPNPETEPPSLVAPALAGSLYPEPPGKPSRDDEAIFFFFWSVFQITFLSVFSSKSWPQFTEQLFLIPQGIGLQPECYLKH